MINVLPPNLYVGSIFDLNQTGGQGWAFVHATQTIHYRILGWDRKYNKPDKNHPNYILYEEGNRLSLNWVDGEAFLYSWSGPETFIKVLDFIDKQIGNRKVLVHCDQGESRGPTTGLLYLAKRSGTIPCESFLVAKREFTKIYPSYLPGGIGEYVAMNWGKIS